MKQESVNISYTVQAPTMRLSLSIQNDYVFVSPFESRKGYRQMANHQESKVSEYLLIESLWNLTMKRIS